MNLASPPERFSRMELSARMCLVFFIGGSWCFACGNYRWTRDDGAPRV